MLKLKKCVPCQGDAKRLTRIEAEHLLKELKNWRIEGKLLTKNYNFPDFKKTLDFVNKVGAIAEGEGHHPDIYFTWGKATIKIYTHVINGLHENDFILAAKIDEI